MQIEVLSYDWKTNQARVRWLVDDATAARMDMYFNFHAPAGQRVDETEAKILEVAKALLQKANTAR